MPEKKFPCRLGILVVVCILLLSCMLFPACASTESGSAPNQSGIGDSSGDSSSGNGSGAALLPQKYIRTARLTAYCTDLSELLRRVRTETDAVGGWISDESTGGEEGARFASLTVRVPAENLDAFLSALDGTGTISQKSVSATDVSGSYMDAQSWVTALEAEYTELLNLYEKAGQANVDATSVSTLLSIRQRITEVLTELTYYQDLLDSYDDQIAYSTVYLSVREDAAEALPPLQRAGQGFLTCLSGVGDFFTAVFVFLVSASPVLVLLAAVAVAVILILRRRKARTRKDSGAGEEHV